MAAIVAETAARPGSKRPLSERQVSELRMQDAGRPRSRPGSIQVTDWHSLGVMDRAWRDGLVLPVRDTPGTCGDESAATRPHARSDAERITPSCREPATAPRLLAIGRGDKRKRTNDIRHVAHADSVSLALAGSDCMNRMPDGPRQAMSPRVGQGTGIVHIHSSYSHDGRDSLEELRAFATDRRITFIAMSDHAEDFTSTRFAEFVRHCETVSDDDLSVIPGLEYRFAGFPGLHLLAFGLREWISPQTPDEFIAQATSRCGMTVLAHPVLARHHVPDAVLAGIQAVEVWNAAYNTRYLPDPRAVDIVHQVRRARSDVVAVAGLDQHDARNDRGLRVVLDRPGHDPLAELRAGRFMNVGGMLEFDATASWTPSRMRALTGARWVLDRVNQLHERVARARA